VFLSFTGGRLLNRLCCAKANSGCVELSCPRVPAACGSFS
jgi:hypothetical protein